MAPPNFRITTREATPGGKEVSFPTRDYKIKSRDFQDVQTANPIPVFWGTVRTAGITMIPVFNFKQSGGGGKSAKGGGAGTTYSGSSAVLIGFGPGDILHQIDNGDTPIWTGPIFRNDAIDGDGKTVLTTTLGKIRFYWGTPDQNVDSILSNIFIDQGNGGQIAPMPAYRNVLFAVMDAFKFGTQQVAPTLYFTISRFPALLPLSFGVTRINIVDGGEDYTTNFPIIFTGGDGSGADATAVVRGGEVVGAIINNPGTGYTVSPAVDLSNGDGTGAAANAYALHEIVGDRVTLGIAKDGQSSPPYITPGDAMIPEIVYDILTNKLYGNGLSADNLIVQDFIDAANTNIIEGFGASPFINENNQTRELIGKLIVYPDSFPYRRNGRIGYKLIRPVDLSGAVSLSEDDFTDELKPENKGMDETWSLTRVTFTDAANHFKSDTEPYACASTADAIGYSVEKQFDYPFVTQRDMAKKIAKRVGVKGSLPPFLYHARLLPKHSALTIGQVVKINYARFGFVDTPARITNIQIGKAASPEVDVDFIADQARDMSNDYTPPQDFLFTPGIIGADGKKDFSIKSTDPRVLWVPAALHGGHPDGWITTFGRTKGTDEGASVWFTFNPAVRKFRHVKIKKTFVIQGQVQNFHRFQNDSGEWIVRIRFMDALALQDFQDMVDAGESAKSEIDPDQNGTSGDFYFTFAQRTKRADSSIDQHEMTGFWALFNFDGYFKQVDDDTYDVQLETGQFTWPDFALETVADPAKTPTQLCYVGEMSSYYITKSNGINFIRDKGNGSGDTLKERRIRVTLKNHKKSQSVDNAPEVDYLRDDTTMCPDGTMTPDWGPAAPTTYELYDQLAGDIFKSNAAIKFNLVEDIDDAMLRFYHGLETDEDTEVFGSINSVLGVRFQLQNGIDNDAPF